MLKSCQPHTRLEGLRTFHSAARRETGDGKGADEGGNSRDPVGVTRPRRLLRRLGVDAGDDMALWWLRDKRNQALSCPAPGPLVPRIPVSYKRARDGELRVLRPPRRAFQVPQVEAIPASRSVVTAPRDAWPIKEASARSSASGKRHCAPGACVSVLLRGSFRPITEAKACSSASGRRHCKPEGEFSTAT